MKTFKAGDKVIRTVNFGHHKVGDTGVVESVVDAGHGLMLKGSRQRFEASSFELIPEPSPLTIFLKTHPWFIRTGTPEKSEAAQKWLFGNGLSWNSGCNSVIPSLGLSILSGCKGSRFWSDDYAPAGVEEITLEFETVVKSFKLPEVKTQQEKLIEDLEETIKKAQQQIEGLKSK